jgi:hypothetical protein
MLKITTAHLRAPKLLNVPTAHRNLSLAVERSTDEILTRPFINPMYAMKEKEAMHNRPRSDVRSWKSTRRGS